MLPTVFSRARGWISDCDITGVCARKRSTMPRTNGRIWAEVTSTGASPSRAASSKRLAHQRDELGQPRRLHRQAAVVALADDRLGEGLLPLRRQRDQRQVAARRGVLRADLAREMRARTCSANVDRVARERQRRRRCLRGWSTRSRIETRSASRICSTRWMPDTVISAGTMSLTSSACSFGRSLSSFVHLAVGQQLRHVGLEQLGQMRRQHGGGVDHGVALASPLLP